MKFSAKTDDLGGHGRQPEAQHRPQLGARRPAPRPSASRSVHHRPSSTTAEAAKLPSSRPRAPSSRTTTSQTVSATVSATLTSEAIRYARARSSTRSSA